MFIQPSINTPRFFSAEQLPKPVTLPRGVAQMQYSRLDLSESHTIGLSPPIQSVQISLQSLCALQQINMSTQLGVVYKHTKGALNSLIQITDKDVKQN